MTPNRIAYVIIAILCFACKIAAAKSDTLTVETESYPLTYSGKLGFRINDPIPSRLHYKAWSSTKLYSDKVLAEELNDTVYLWLVDSFESDYQLPIKGPLTSNFGWRRNRHHSGIDIDLVYGDSVVSSFDGVVRLARYYGAFGNLVVVRHYNGLETFYAHLSKMNVAPGDKVKAGDLLGKGGSTGRSTGSHLHYEIRYRGLSIDPNYMINLKTGKLKDPELLIYKDLFNHSRSKKNPAYRRYSVKLR